MPPKWRKPPSALGAEQTMSLSPPRVITVTRTADARHELAPLALPIRKEHQR